MTRKEYIIELEKQGYKQLREDVFIKNNDIYHLEEICHCIIEGVRQCDYELIFTGEHKCCLYCHNSYLKDLGLNDEDVVICSLTNEYIGYPGDDAITCCCEKWIY